MAQNIAENIEKIKDMMRESLATPELFEHFSYQDGLTHALQELLDEESFRDFLDLLAEES